jgi:hypothetical protein
VQITHLDFLSESNEALCKQYNMNPFYLWSTLCYESDVLTSIAHAERQHRWKDLNRKSKKGMTQAEIERAHENGQHPLLGEPQHWVRGSPPLNPQILNIHFRIMKRKQVYWCCRMQGSNCIYDTFWAEPDIVNLIATGEERSLQDTPPFVTANEIAWERFDDTRPVTPPAAPPHHPEKI